MKSFKEFLKECRFCKICKSAGNRFYFRSGIYGDIFHHDFIDDILRIFKDTYFLEVNLNTGDVLRFKYQLDENLEKHKNKKMLLIARCIYCNAGHHSKIELKSKVNFDRLILKDFEYVYDNFIFQFHPHNNNIIIFHRNHETDYWHELFTYNDLKNIDLRKLIEKAKLMLTFV